MTTAQRELLIALSSVLNTHGIIPPLSQETIVEAKQQAIYLLIGKELTAISNNIQLLWEQQRLEEILHGIPYLVLKGSAASIYYPEPLRRTLGDIDIVVRLSL